MSKTSAVVLDSNKEEINKLSQKWQDKKRLGERLMKIGGSGFVVTLLSPFDFEGPVAEIATAVIAGVGYGMKEIAEYKLEGLEQKTSKTR